MYPPCPCSWQPWQVFFVVAAAPATHSIFNLFRLVAICGSFNFFSEFSFVQFYFFAAASLSENFINCFASTCGLKSPSQHHNPYIPTHTHTHNTPLSNQLTFFRKHFFLLPIFFLFTVFLLQIKFVSNEWAVGWQAGAKAFMPLWQVNFNFIANWLRFEWNGMERPAFGNVSPLSHWQVALALRPIADY